MGKDNILLPLIVSITGHRDITTPSVDVIKNKVKSSLKYLRYKYPNTPIWVYTALADGADRIVAHAVLEMKKAPEEELDLRLIAPLPLEIEDYKRDFSEASKQELDELISSVDEYYVLDPYLYTAPDGRQITQDG